MLSNKLTRVPQIVRAAQRTYATAAPAKTAAGKGFGAKPLVPPKIALPPLNIKPQQKDPEPFSDDYEDIPIPFSGTPISPIVTPPQPFAKKPAPSSKAFPSSPVPPPPSTAGIPLPPSLANIPPAPAASISAPPPPAPAQGKKPAGKAAARKPAASNASAPNPNAAASAQGKAIAKELGGRTPAQLLNQITQLQNHNATLQSQLVYHSAVEAIYGESGFNQMRNIISEFTEEEANILKAAGFESENVIHHLEARQRDLCTQFTQTMGADLAKYINAYVKKLKDQHRQSASAATATQQTLRNAGVPDTVISSTLVGLQPHLDELQTRIVRWEKLKADVDLLIATHSGNH